jgi:hypothetical protein
VGCDEKIPDRERSDSRGRCQEVEVKISEMNLLILWRIKKRCVGCLTLRRGRESMVGAESIATRRLALPSY